MVVIVFVLLKLLELAGLVFIPYGLGSWFARGIKEPEKPGYGRWAMGAGILGAVAAVVMIGIFIGKDFLPWILSLNWQWAQALVGE